MQIVGFVQPVPHQRLTVVYFKVIGAILELKGLDPESGAVGEVKSIHDPNEGRAMKAAIKSWNFSCVCFGLRPFEGIHKKYQKIGSSFCGSIPSPHFGNTCSGSGKTRSE